MTKYTLSTSVMVSLFVGGCVAATPPSQPSAVSTDDCPVLEASDFVAWVNTSPGPEAPKLNVTGKITLPSGGYAAKLKPGILDRRQPPLQRLILEITPPDSLAMQAITTIELNDKFSALAKNYRGVTIVCGARAIAEITEVEIVS